MAEQLDTPEFQEQAANEEGEPDEEYEPQAILDERMRRNKVQYLIHWRGYKKSEASWEPEAHIKSCSDVIKAWQEKIMKALSKSNKPKPNTTRKRVRPDVG